MTGISKKTIRFVSIYEYNIVFLSKRFYSSFDQNFYVFERFRFDIESVLYRKLYYRREVTLLLPNFRSFRF